MTSELAPRPLLSWNGFTLRLDLDMLELWLNRTLPAKVDAVRRVAVGGEGERVELAVDVSYKGLPARLVAHLTELRLYHRFVGCRVVSVRGPFGLPMPLDFVARFVNDAPGGIVRLDHADRILLVDLQRVLPAWLDMQVLAARCSGRWLEFEMAPGSLAARFGPPEPLPEI